MLCGCGFFGWLVWVGGFLAVFFVCFFFLNIIRKNHLIRHWNGLPWEGVEFPSLDVFKRHMDLALEDIV